VSIAFGNIRCYAKNCQSFDVLYSMTDKKPKSTPAKTDKAPKNNIQPPSYNGWRVLALFIEGIFNLINNNKIYPTLAMMLMAILGVIVWRLPETGLAEIIKSLIDQKGLLIFLLIVTNMGWYKLYKTMKTLYQDEINRLADIRKKLMHGTENTIENHRSTQDDCKESYILPAPNKDRSDSSSSRGNK